MPARLIVRAVESRRDMRNFIFLPWRIYLDNPNWVPPLIVEEKERFNRKKHPFFRHSEAQFFIAIRNGQTIGRIAAIHNRRHNEYHKENTGFFGFFECVKDYEVAAALFDTALDWVRKRSLASMLGPTNYSTNEEAGFLLEGYDMPPSIMMPYNPPYYVEFAERWGMKKAKDLLAYHLHADEVDFAKSKRISDKLLSSTGIELRKVNMRNFEEEVNIITGIYNEAWSQNWGFVPITDEEVNFTARKMKRIVIPDLVLIATVKGKPVGFSLALPDINLALRKIGGRLFPTGIFRLLREVKKIRSMRLLMMGVISEYRKRGTDALFYFYTYHNGVNIGFREAEFSWILEDNVVMNNTLKSFGARVYKKYRIYTAPV